MSVPVVTIPGWVRQAGLAVCAVLIVATASTAVGAYAYDRGVRSLKAGDLGGAGKAFLLATVADPFRSASPDSLSAVHYRRYLMERSAGGGEWGITEQFLETIRWEDRARTINPRELKYTLRLSRLFLELFRLRGHPSDALMSYRLAGSALRINPFGVEILWHRADVLEAVGRGDEAAQDLQTAVAVEPNFCRGYARLADLAGTADPEASSRWVAKAQECRTKAAVLPLEDYEKWLVESPEER